MFGYVRAREDILSPEERANYEAAYCGLCHTLKEQYGTISRLFLYYDFVFLAMLLADNTDVDCKECVKCPQHPWKGTCACCEGTWLEVAAGESVILTWWKLQDTIADSKFFPRIAAKIVCLLLSPAYQKAKTLYTDFDSQTAAFLEELRDLEQRKSSSIDHTSDCFARILQKASPETGQPEIFRPRQQLLYHLGRWIYLIDAVDDLQEDQKKGNYNPISFRFPLWSEQDQTYLRKNMDHSLELVGSAFQLLPQTPWSGILENIIYSGLPSVEELVFSGKWQENQKKRRRRNP